MTIREKRQCRICKKELKPYKNNKGIWVIRDYCDSCFPEEKLHSLTCEKCNNIFYMNEQRTERKYCPECSSMNQDKKELVCPKCGKTYYAVRSPDGRHFRHKRICDDCAKPATEKTVYCEKCGKPFIVTKYPGTDSFKQQRYCSNFCASTQTEFRDGKVQWKKTTTKCKHCGKEIELERNAEGKLKLRTVCDDCLKPKAKAPTTTRICSICGKEFTVSLEPCGNYSSTQYCSDECASEGFRSKCKKTCQEKYGVDYPCLTDNAIEHNVGNVVSEINLRFAKQLEKQSINFEHEFKLGSYSYDFKIKNTNYLIEINPTYTHNSYFNHFGKIKTKTYHYDKTKFALNNDYVCVCIWDWDSWDNVIDLFKKHKIQLKEKDIQLHYSKGRENIVLSKENNKYIEEGYLPVYDDGFEIIA